MKKRSSIAFVALAIALFVSILQSAPASAATSGEFVSKINGLRASKGLGALSVDGRLSGVAQAWAEKMAAANKISHNPALGSVPGNWTKVGENVGTGGDVDAIFDALVASSGHYRNMVEGSFNSIGVGVAVGSDNRIYTSHVFAAYPGAGGSSGSASSSPAPKVAAAAKPAAPKPTAAPKPAAKPKPVSSSAKAVQPAPPPAPAVAAPAPAPAPAPVLPTPSARIVQGLAEVGSIATQG